MDEVHRGYRISVAQVGGKGPWRARVTEARGVVVPITARATPAEGAEVCLTRARRLIERYIAYLNVDAGPESESGEV